MSSYKSVAVVGAGRLGTCILSALAATEKISVILLSRPGSSKSAPPGVLVVPVDYTDVNTVSSVFKEHKVDVVLSTLGHEGIGMQKSLADAAKLAAVKLFVPSEFGSPTHGHAVEAYKAKNEIAGKIIDESSLILGEPHQACT
jgi:D-arabinose 1-dehydrogenase-like Zn-dependent alcohol dehydrogenase